MSLDRIPLSRPVRITRVDAQDSFSYRLMEMGLIEGADIEVVGRAPLGGPIHVRLGDSELSIRCEEAERVDVTSL